jgi:hypothetical protein
MGNLDLDPINNNPTDSDSALFSVPDLHVDPSTNPYSLKIFHQNICGLGYKTNELICSLYPNCPHIICITEHRLNLTESNSIEPATFRFVT